MAEHVDVTLQIRDSSRAPTYSALELDHLSLSTRVGRALGRLFICWAIAGVSMLVPLLHFVLVPGFFIAGLALAAVAFKATVVVRTPKVTCPKCEQLTLVETGATGWPVTIWCTACSTTFFAVPAETQKQNPSSDVSST